MVRIFIRLLTKLPFSSPQNPQENKSKMSEKRAKMLASLNPTKKPSRQKRVKESTIMKWLNNSDLKKNEGSLDIFKAICNENEEDDEEAEEGDSSDAENPDYDIKSKEPSAEFIQKSNNFTSILKNVEQNLKQLEAEIEHRTATGGDDKTNCASNDKERRAGDKDMEKKEHIDVYEFDEENSDDHTSGAQAKLEDERISSRNGEETSSTCATSSSYKVLSKNNKKYQLLKSSVNMLREAFNEIRDTVKDNNECSSGAKIQPTNSSPPPLVKLQPYFSNNATMPNNHSLMETPESSRASCDDIIDLVDTDSISEVESLSLNSPVYSTHSTIKQQQKQTSVTAHNNALSNNLLEEQLKEYQEQVGKLNEKLHHTELEAQHTLEIMQVECDEVKQKMLNLNHIIEVLKEDKKALEQVITENKNNKTKMEQESPSSSLSHTPPHEQSLETSIEASTNRVEEEVLENDLADINITALEREEELITYKERLDEQQQQNIELRNEIATLKLKAAAAAGGVTAICAGATKTDVLLKRVLPYGFVVLAIVVYFITTYF